LAVVRVQQRQGVHEARHRAVAHLHPDAAAGLEQGAQRFPLIVREIEYESSPSNGTYRSANLSASRHARQNVTASTTPGNRTGIDSSSGGGPRRSSFSISARSAAGSAPHRGHRRA